MSVSNGCCLLHSRMPLLISNFTPAVFPPQHTAVNALSACNQSLKYAQPQNPADREATHLFCSTTNTKKTILTAQGNKHESTCTGDKAQQRRNDREEKAASTAALLQHVLGDPKFGKAVQELESCFGAKFSDFITGQHCLLLHVHQRDVNCVLAHGGNQSSTCGLQGSINCSRSSAFNVILLPVLTPY